jgi:hypothetical protein
MRATRSAIVALLLALAAPPLLAAVTGCYSSASRGSDAGSGNAFPVEATGRTRVDLLFLVDNSGSMSQAQAAMTNYLGAMIRALVDPPDTDGDTRPDALPVEDLHVGIISSDVGTMGFRVSTCLADPLNGDDGCLLHNPNPLVGDCAESYPTFLSRDSSNATTYTPERLAGDFACIGTLGTNGCGLEQQLESLRRAVVQDNGPGRCNDGFLRPDSVLAAVVITDENDCSISPEHPEFFDMDRTDLGHMGVGRMLLHPEMLQPVEWFRDQLLSIRPRAAESIVLAEIVGVPVDSVCEGPGASLVDCLALPAMQETLDPAMPTQLIPSCNTTMGIAFPPRRIVELARLWNEAGGGTYVGSICRTAWTAAATGIGQEITERLRPECLPYELDVEAGACAVSCSLVEMLPADRTCTSDDFCPPEACPAATLDEVLSGNASPCRLPGADSDCEPLARDLGLVELPGGTPFRACLVRQDAGTYDAALARCVPPAPASGWRYVSPEWDDAAGGPCPRLELPDAIRDQREAGAVLRLYCGDLACPIDRQCGPPGRPAAPCCAAGSFCARDAATGEGACIEPDD